jgi:hypothetical protein
VVGHFLRAPEDLDDAPRNHDFSFPRLSEHSLFVDRNNLETGEANILLRTTVNHPVCGFDH